jgi:hypothetical protein
MAVYNDDVVIDSLVNFGYCVEEACRYANDGCWEVQIPGKTSFRYWSWDVLADLQQSILHLGDTTPSQLPYESFDELFEAYEAVLKETFRKNTEYIRQV